MKGVAPFLKLALAIRSTFSCFQICSLALFRGSSHIYVPLMDFHPP